MEGDMKYCGIDLHGNNSVVVVQDEADRVMYSKRHGNSLREIVEALAPYREELVGVVIESTYNWYWLVDGLMDAGHRVHLANTAAIKQYEGIKHRGDESDAGHLAKLLRLKLLPEGHIMPREKRGMRDLARRRMQLVQQRTSQILSIESNLDRHTGGHMNANHIKCLEVADLEGLALSPSARLALSAHLAVMQALQIQIDLLEAELKRHCRQDPLYRLLKTTPGIGEVLGSVILLETGELTRFCAVGNYASYSRCVGSKHESNGRKKGEGNTKNGNRYLAWAFVEAANFAVRYCEPARRYYQRKKAKHNSTLAIKAVAHKLARACYHIMKNQQPFNVERCFG